jgi:hypothetical protein
MGGAGKTFQTQPTKATGIFVPAWKKALGLRQMSPEIRQVPARPARQPAGVVY